MEYYVVKSTESSKKHQHIVVATYGNRCNSARHSELLGEDGSSHWRPIYLPINPSGAYMGEVISQHGIKKIAIYLDSPEKMPMMQYEVRLLRRLLPNRTKIFIGGAIHEFIGKFCSDIVAEPHDSAEDFFATLDQRLKQCQPC